MHTTKYIVHADGCGDATASGLAWVCIKPYVYTNTNQFFHKAHTPVCLQ